MQALLYVAAEDEAFTAFNREIDARSRQSERRDDSVPSNAQEWDSMEVMALAGKSINEWLNELDTIAKEVEAELVSRDIGCHLVEVLEAVNLVLFESRGFKRPPVLVDPKFSYLHSVLGSGCGSGKASLCICFLNTWLIFFHMQGNLITLSAKYSLIFRGCFMPTDILISDGSNFSQRNLY